MKKAILILFCASLMILSFSSCSKKCKCKNYVGGFATSEKEIKLEKGKKCSDYTYTTEIEGKKLGTECK